MSVHRLLAKLAIGACAAVGFASQVFAASPEGMKPYVFTSQPLDIARSALSAAATGSEKFMIPVAFFLIKHPKGNIFFDTGDNDKVITQIVRRRVHPQPVESHEFAPSGLHGEASAHPQFPRHLVVVTPSWRSRKM